MSRGAIINCCKFIAIDLFRYILFQRKKKSPVTLNSSFNRINRQKTIFLELFLQQLVLQL